MSREFLDQNGNVLTLIDGDTAVNAEGKRFRLDGFNAFETEKVIENEDGGYEYKSGNVFGQFQTDTVADMIRTGNFTGKYTGEMDDYDREVLKITNPENQSLPAELLKQGIAKVDNYTSEEDVAKRDQYELANALMGNSPTPYDQIGEKYRNTIAQLPLTFKGTALDESTYDPDLHSGVAFRRDDRTIDNKPLGMLNSAAHSFGFGLEGVQEGLYGYAQGLGEITGFQALEDLGQQGLWRSREAIKNAPDLILDYRDVNTITDGFQYVLNTAATSAPYMMGGFASIAASIPLAGLTGPLAAGLLAHIPNAMIYAGHTWNEMEGEKGIPEFITANVSGVLQATLERVGLKGLMQPVDMLSKAGRQRVIKAISERMKMTPAMAEQTLNAQLKGQIGKVVAYMASDFAKFSYGSFGKSMAKGLTRESVTEMLQEATQSAAVTFGSDTPFDPEEFKHRLMNAGIGGAVLGGGLSGAGNAYRQGQNQLKKHMATVGNEFKGTPLEVKRQRDESLGVKIPTIEEGIATQEGSIRNINDPLNPTGAETTIVYDKEGNPIEVLIKKEMDANGILNVIPNVVIDKVTKEEFQVNESKYFSKSIWDNTLDIDQLGRAGRGTDGKFFKLGDLSRAQLEKARKILFSRLNTDRIGHIPPGLLRLKSERLLNAINRQLLNRSNDPNDYKPRPTEDIKVKPFNKATDPTKLNDLSKNHIENKRGASNILRGVSDLKDFITVMATGASKIVRSVDKYMMSHKKLITSPIALEIFSRLAGLTTGSYNAGKNFVEYAKSIVSDLRMLVDENQIAQNILGKRMTADRAVVISKKLIEFGEPIIIKTEKGNDKITPSRFMLIKAYLWGEQNGFDITEAYKKLSNEIIQIENFVKDKKNTAMDRQKANTELQKQYKQRANIIAQYEASGIDFIRNEHMDLQTILKEKTFMKDYKNKFNSALAFEEETNLFIAASQLKASNDLAFKFYNREYRKEKGKNLVYDKDYWWKNQGFDWRKVKDKPTEFKAWLIKNELATEITVEGIYSSIAREGQVTITGQGSLMEGKPYSAWAFSNRFRNISNTDGFSEWSSGNLFETLKRTQVEVGKYVSTAHYFGEGGWKLNQLFEQLEQELDNDLTQDDIDQFAFYTKAIIDSAQGNFNRIESKNWAAINNYLSSWAIFSGLPIAMLSSLPETLMIYFNLKSDRDFQKANELMITTFTGMFDQAVKAEVKRHELLLKQLGLSTDQSTIVDRYATGERDISFMRAHETFFRATGIQRITQVQRRMNAAMGHDFIMSGFQVLALAPRKKLDIANYNTYKRNIKNLMKRANKLSKANKEKSPEMDSVANEIEKQQTLLSQLSSREFDFEKFTDEEMLTYNQLRSLGINVTLLDTLMSHLETLQRDKVFDMIENDNFNQVTPYDSMFDTLNREDIISRNYDDKDGKLVREITPRESVMRQIARGEFQSDNNLTFSELDLVERAGELQSQIDEEIETGIYRFVNERIQLPGASNRPLFFQDPHYQLLTQFNGFLSTFTANIVPKLWNTNLRKGNTKVKYDTFVLILLMMGMGGGSQYLKDLMKFGEASPYLDKSGYLQRALYSSGVIGQYERVLDAVAPLYPERFKGLDSIADKILGESGPAARNIQNVITGIGQAASGDTPRAVNSFMKTAPYVAPLPSARNAAVEITHGRNPLPETVNEFFFGN